MSKFHGYIGTVCEEPKNSDDWIDYKDASHRTWVWVEEHSESLFPLTRILKKLSKRELALE